MVPLLKCKKKFRLTLAVALTFACVCVAAQQSAVTPLPSTPKQPVVDEYHATLTSPVGQRIWMMSLNLE